MIDDVYQGEKMPDVQQPPKKKTFQQIIDETNPGGPPDVQIVQGAANAAKNAVVDVYDAIVNGRDLGSPPFQKVRIVSTTTNRHITADVPVGIAWRDP